MIGRYFRTRELLMLLCLLTLFALTFPSQTLYEADAAPKSLVGHRTENPGAFLSWPLPSYVGLTSITYLPNSRWTLNFLGISECPPYPALIDSDGQDGRAYWPYYDWGRHNTYSYLILPHSNKARAKWQNWDNRVPGFGNSMACYSRQGYLPDHKGTDMSARNGTPVYAAAWADQITVVRSYIGYRVTLRHPNVNGTGQTWYTFYDHLSSSNYYTGTYYPTGGIRAGQQIGNVGLNHLHFQLGVNASYGNASARNPWGIDSYPWTGCLWLNQNTCPRW